MKIGEARNAYYKKFQEFSGAAADAAKQKQEAERNAKLDPLNAKTWQEEAARLELSQEAYKKKAEEYLDFQSKIIDQEVALANMQVAGQQAEALEESAAEEMKCLETARRISRGDNVPAQDEQKLLEYNYKMYMMAKQSYMMAREHEDDKSLWEEEEESEGGEAQNPMEYADDQEAMGGGPDLDLGVPDVDVSGE